MGLHTPLFSHEFNEGPSGPARSYWDIRRGTRTLGSICLHHRREVDPVLTAQSICHMLDAAFAAGRSDKATEIARALEIRP